MDSVPKKRKTVIVVSGWKGSGKDTLADFLVYNHGFERFAFADALKDYVATEYEIDRISMDDPNKKEQPILSKPVIVEDSFAWTVVKMVYTHLATSTGAHPKVDTKYRLTRDDEGIVRWKEYELYWTPRAALICEGSLKRTINLYHWVDRVGHMILNTCDRAVIADWRYRREADRIRELLEIIADIYYIRVDVEGPPVSTDASERSLDDFTGFHARILNTKDGFDKYHAKIWKVIEPMVG